MQTKPNPVRTMDSVDALDLMQRVCTEHIESLDPALCASLEEQILRHRRALVPVIGEEEL